MGFSTEPLKIASLHNDHYIWFNQYMSIYLPNLIVWAPKQHYIPTEADNKQTRLWLRFISDPSPPVWYPLGYPWREWWWWWWWGSSQIIPYRIVSIIGNTIKDLIANTLIPPTRKRDYNHTSEKPSNANQTVTRWMVARPDCVWCTMMVFCFCPRVHPCHCGCVMNCYNGIHWKRISLTELCHGKTTADESVEWIHDQQSTNTFRRLHPAKRTGIVELGLSYTSYDEPIAKHQLPERVWGCC